MGKVAVAPAPGLLPHQHHRALGTVKKTKAHIERVHEAQKRENAKGAQGNADLGKRSSKWPTFRRKYIAAHKAKGGGCEACGSKVGLQLHHKQPFHSDPSRELDPTNVIVLCEYVGGLECHEHIGHDPIRGFKWYNPNVAADAADLMAHPDQLDAIKARVHADAKPNQPGD